MLAVHTPSSTESICCMLTCRIEMRRFRITISIHNKSSQCGTEYRVQCMHMRTCRLLLRTAIHMFALALLAAELPRRRRVCPSDSIYCCSSYSIHAKTWTHADHGLDASRIPTPQLGTKTGRSRYRVPGSPSFCCTKMLQLAQQLPDTVSPRRPIGVVGMA